MILSKESAPIGSHWLGQSHQSFDKAVEFKVLAWSPSGEWMNIKCVDGSKGWVSVVAIEALERLPDSFCTPF